MLLVVRRPFFRSIKVFSKFESPNLIEIGRIVRVGLPIGISMFLGMAVFSAIGVLVGRIGVTELAAHSIAGNLNWLTYVIPMGLGAAASIRVGFYTGAADFTAARLAAATAYGFALVYALVVSVLLIVFRADLVAVYSNDAAVLEIAANLLIFIAIYQIVDDTQATAVGALRGYKDTRMPMIYQLVGYWVIALPLGSLLAFGWQGIAPLGVYGYWAGLTLGLFLVTVANTSRLWHTSHDEARITRLLKT
jgi:MATE family multidrug resistance protein